MIGFERADDLAGNLGQAFNLVLYAVSQEVAFIPSDSEVFV